MKQLLYKKLKKLNQCMNNNYLTRTNRLIAINNGIWNNGIEMAFIVPNKFFVLGKDQDCDDHYNKCILTYTMCIFPNLHA